MSVPYTEFLSFVKQLSFWYSDTIKYVTIALLKANGRKPITLIYCSKLKLH